MLIVASATAALGFAFVGAISTVAALSPDDMGYNRSSTVTVADMGYNRGAGTNDMGYN
ncbi:hypothetical protein LWC34_43925 [Kibdelosporangium philippinense]|uniref:Uncharacterized protein n=1 Tax=Kibdelosporangium philippinense TaxID=211113 RepID=A0ABS8ZQ52_9PSEU|nr:hypothetical protein [Kibdelosporangium philippinense]MCE7009712.1 hypothetical protein [Kibdelosporangium philippinense]